MLEHGGIQTLHGRISFGNVCRLVDRFYSDSLFCLSATLCTIAGIRSLLNTTTDDGNRTQKHWDEAEQWQRDSAILGVQFRLNNPDAKEDAQHNAWMKDKVDAGWVYGEMKDAEKKTHPCIVPFEQLPEFQRKKDSLFCAIVDALK